MPSHFKPASRSSATSCCSGSRYGHLPRTRSAHASTHVTDIRSPCLHNITGLRGDRLRPTWHPLSPTHNTCLIAAAAGGRRFRPDHAQIDRPCARSASLVSKIDGRNRELNTHPRGPPPAPPHSQKTTINPSFTLPTGSDPLPPNTPSSRP